MITFIISLLDKHHGCGVLLGLLITIFVSHQLFFNPRNDCLKRYAWEEMQRLKTEAPARHAALEQNPGYKLGDILDAERYCSADISPRLESLGAKGRFCYAASEVTLDLLFPLVFYPFLALTIAALAGTDFASSRLAQACALAALAGAVADYLENFSIAALCLRYPDPLEPITAALPYFTKAKIILIMAPLSIAVLSWLVRWILTFSRPA